MLAPTLGAAAKRQAASGDLNGLLGALKGQDQGAMFDDAAVAASPEGQAQGMAFLSSLLGDTEATEALAGEAASRTGIDMSVVQKFLPALAGMTQGGLQKTLDDRAIDGMMGGGQAAGLMGMVGGLLGGGSRGGDMSALTALLDEDGDGSVMDDILQKLLK